jgi:hypothetical protein
MEDQTVDQFDRADLRGTAAAYTRGTQQRVNEPRGENLPKESLEGGRRNDGFVSHPQLNGVLSERVQV